MRTIEGSIEVPVGVARRVYGRMVVEVRDVSRADAPSLVVAEDARDDVVVDPGEPLRFALQVPDVEPGRSLSLRVHVSCDGSPGVKRGDLLTTASHPIPPRGDRSSLRVPVKVV
ncbi:hypothetical protein OJF2_67310 [Aquisphaera giovannonii]|uniref:Uncharacterized protein n=1 Tax=Aquisphaera giovannonii TaxID=406548 RepID=A0A5B9WCB8_9BACT|nr:YbaY family lipoprotein [Aquisphaera giovannonii]QEH38133.1 hypothetical protein OJF2_67310 [Aquisphaera giovannonii]